MTRGFTANYDPVPTVSPTSLPDASQQVQTDPAAFGAAGAQAQERFGQALNQAGQTGVGIATDVQNIYNQTTADDAYNQLQDSYYKLQYGDPNDPQSKGYYSLMGQDALNARAGVAQQMETMRQQLGAGLSPRARLEFESNSRRLQSMTMSGIGRHADQQFQVYADGTQAATQTLALRGIGTHWNDDSQFDLNLQNGLAATTRRAQLAGAAPEVLDAELQKYKGDAVSTRVTAQAVTDPEGAQSFLNRHRDNLDADTFAKLSYELDNRVWQKQGQGIVGEVLGQTPAAGAASEMPDMDGYLAVTKQIENPHNDPRATSSTGAKGDYQFTGSTWAQYGNGADPYDAQANKAAAIRLTNDNYAFLKAHLGREPSPAEVYLAHQQGAQGAFNLISNPNSRAGDLTTDQAIRVNGGNPNDTGAAFVSQWTNKFNRLSGGGVQTQPLGAPAPQGVVPTPSPDQLAQDPQAGLLASVPEAAAPGSLQANAQVAAQVPAAAPAGLTGQPPGLPSKGDALAQIHQIVQERYGGDPNIEKAAIAELNQNYAAKQAQWTDDQRERELHKQQVEQASDARENDYLKNIYTSSPSVKAGDVLNDDTLTREAKARLASAIERSTKPDPIAPISQKTAADMLDRIRLPEGDPRKITSVDPIYDAFKNQQLSKGDFNFVMGEYRNQTDASGDTVPKMQGRFIEGMKSQITQANPLLGQMDPTGDAQYYQFQFDVAKKIADYKAQGKNPMDLFDPGNAAYLGSPQALQPYKKTLSQSMQTMTQGLRGVGGPVPAAVPGPQGGAANIVPRQAGETVEQYLARTGGMKIPPAAPQVPTGE